MRIVSFVAASLSLVFCGVAHSIEFDPIHDSHRYAWDLFIELSHPADPSNPGRPHPTKNLGDPGDVVWESWALAKRDVFREDCANPGEWGTWGAAAAEAFSRARELLQLGEPASKADLVEMLRSRSSEDRAEFRFDPTEPTSETRMNLPAFEFIRDNGLYTIEGQERFHESGKIIDLPHEAQEIKSAWRLLSSAEAASERYHMHVGDDGKTYGLIALHIITKDLPQWFWTTFEHMDNADLDIRDASRDVRWLDPYTNGGKSDSLPEVIKGTKWQYYRLKGVQTDFVSLDGRPTILANAIIERGFMGTSSCVSCHAHATIGASQEVGKDNRLPIFEEIRTERLFAEDPESATARFIVGWTGTPNRELFYDRDYGAKLSPKKRYTQTDFMWSFFRAHSENSESCRE